MPVRRRTAIVSCLLVVAALATGGVVAFTWSTGTAPAAPTAATPTVPVVAGTVKSGDVPIYLGGIGFVQAYNTVVVRSQIQGQLIQIPFTEEYLPQIQQQRAKGELTVLAYSQDDKIKLDQGTLKLVDNQIIQTSGSVRLKADFPNPANRLWPGELVNLRLLLETRPDGLTVAAPVVQRGPQGTYAYVIKPDNTIESRAVTVAQITNGQALIDSGLKPGEQGVVDGHSKLQPGSHVTVLHGKAAQEAVRQSAQQADIP